MALKQWVVYIDEKTDKVGAIENDHVGVEDMIENRSGWKILGHVAFKHVYNAVAYGEQVFADPVISQRRK